MSEKDPSTTIPATEAGGLGASTGTGSRPRILILGAGHFVHGETGEALRARFDLREAAEDDAAWQAILLDSSIRVVAGDVHAPDARTIELFARVRGSKVQRIRERPLIALLRPGLAVDAPRLASLDASMVLTGDERGAAPLDELLARLGVLLEISRTRDNLSESSSGVDSARTVDPETDLLHIDAFDLQVNRLLSFARRSFSDVALISILVELRLPRAATWEGEVEQRMKLVGRALSTAMRLEDLGARTDATAFCVATQNRSTTDMLRFAARLRKVLENVDAAGPGVEVWTSIGLATLSEELRRNARDLRALSHKRALMAQHSKSRRIVLGSGDAGGAAAQAAGERGSMDIPLALALIGAGRSAEVVPHLPRLIEQINPLLHVIRQQQQNLGVGGSQPASGSPPASPKQGKP
jgi:PleD family two-component response regulator